MMGVKDRAILEVKYAYYSIKEIYTSFYQEHTKPWDF
jgi:hypothetical protein